MATVEKTTKNLRKTEVAKPLVQTTADKARLALQPSVNGAAVIEAYQASVLGKDADINVMMTGCARLSKT